MFNSTLKLTINKTALCSALSFILFNPAHSSFADNWHGHRLLKGLPTSSGARITPMAAPGASYQVLYPELPQAPGFRAGQGMTTSISPNGKTLLVLTTGYNLWYDPSFKPMSVDEFIFVYDISSGKPVKIQALTVPNSFMGIVWHPNGKAFYVAGGINDNIHIYEHDGKQWAHSANPIPLGHERGNGLTYGNVAPLAAGLAINRDGTQILVTNMENDSVSLVDLVGRKVIAEQDLRPGKIDLRAKGIAGGEFPGWVVLKDNGTAYVSSIRDREIVRLKINDNRLQVTGRFPVQGNPGRMILDKAQRRLFVTLDNSDQVAIFNADTMQQLASIDVSQPFQEESGKRYTGSHPNSLVLSPDENKLYVTLGGTNSLALFDLGRRLDDKARDGERFSPRFLGMIPTGWNPSSVSVNAKSGYLYVINSLSSAGPNEKACPSPKQDCQDGVNGNQYVLQLRHGGLLSMPEPDRKQLRWLTDQVLANNGALDRDDDHDNKMAFLHSKIKHVIYIVKENRTYDQVLGDLEKGNGDPSLNLFPESISPNHHALARNFVTLDNTLVSGAVSGDGWVWSTAGRVSDYTEKAITVNYAGRGLNYDFEGMNRDINVSQETVAERRAVNSYVPEDEDLLPGTADVAALDGPEGEEGKGYLWDVAQKAGLTVRNYAFYGDWTLNYLGNEQQPPLLREPAKDGVQVFHPAATGLKDVSDIYYREYDMKLPDYWRFKEWEREYDQFVAKGEMPSLMLVELPHDHFGEFGGALDGVDTPETQMADNDYAFGLLVQKVANSPYKDDTLIFLIEDDTQDGPDHVDAQRSIAYVVGPYVKQGEVVSKRYTTVNMLRTIVDVLGIEPMGLQVALAKPMGEVFSRQYKKWDYNAIVPDILRTTQLPLPEKTSANSLATASAKAYVKPLHDAAYWKEKTVVAKH